MQFDQLVAEIKTLFWKRSIQTAKDNNISSTCIVTLTCRGSGNVSVFETSTRPIIAYFMRVTRKEVNDMLTECEHVLNAVLYVKKHANNSINGSGVGWSLTNSEWKDIVTEIIGLQHDRINYLKSLLDQIKSDSDIIDVSYSAMDNFYLDIMPFKSYMRELSDLYVTATANKRPNHYTGPPTATKDPPMSGCGQGHGHVH